MADLLDKVLEAGGQLAACVPPPAGVGDTGGLSRILDDASAEAMEFTRLDEVG